MWQFLIKTKGDFSLKSTRGKLNPSKMTPYHSKDVKNYKNTNLDVNTLINIKKIHKKTLN